MHIIPVIDLLDGHVVHAKHGERHDYKPISSKLTTSSKPVDIVKAFLEIYPFQTLYIADLNAIQSANHNHHLGTIEAIRSNFPDLNIWLDAGINNQQKLRLYQPLGITPILGTESLSNLQSYQALKSQLAAFVLSIDIQQQGYIGPSELLEPREWPEDIIIMTLANVGSFKGINMHMLQHYQQQAPEKNIYAAGGVGHIEDLKQLKQNKLQGALIASALHSQAISSHDLEKLLT